MEKIVYIFLAEGFEEMEAIAVIDVLRRAEITVKSVSVSSERMVKGANGIEVKSDLLFGETDFADALFVVLPGGVEGTNHLEAHEGLSHLLKSRHEKKEPIAAICAAPSILGKLGMMEGRQATCYPGFDKHLKGATYVDTHVVRDGHFITGQGPGACLNFAFALLEAISGKEKADQLKQGMCVKN